MTLIFYHKCHTTSDQRRLDNNENFQEFVKQNWKHLAYGRSVLCNSCMNITSKHYYPNMLPFEGLMRLLVTFGLCTTDSHKN